MVKLTSKHLENPVLITKDCYVENEAGEKLCSRGHANYCIAWCERNGCAPIPFGWNEFNSQGYPSYYYDLAKANDALMVIAATPEIRAYLKAWDPMALKQVEKALGRLKPTPKTHPKTFEKKPKYDVNLPLNPKAAREARKEADIQEILTAASDYRVERLARKRTQGR
jgi:hypothetical protein